MPLLEGLSYSSDKNVVILDIGAAYTKCGLAGETCPRCIVPSEVINSKSGKVVKLWEFNDVGELFENLKDFLFNLYFRQLLINPKDRRVVVCESILCPSKFRETLAKVLFKHFEALSVIFAAGHLTSLLTLGTNTGLVMDIGYTEALVVPVYEGIPVLKALQSAPLGGQAIERRIEEQLKDTCKITMENGEEKPVSSLLECLNQQILEDIKVRCCFVTNINRAKSIHDVTIYGEDSSKLPKPPYGLEYPLDGGKVLHIPGSLRENSCEVLFEQDNEEKSISTILLDSIIKCPIDIRKEMAQSIVIIGGTSMLPGFQHRIISELYALMKKPKYQQELSVKKFKMYKLPAKENYAAWLGGAFVGALETLPSRSISRESYNQNEKLTDWCCVAEESETEKSEKTTTKTR